MPVAVHDAEDRSSLDPGGFTPPLERPNGTGRTPSATRNADRSSLPFLIGLSTAHGNDESAGPRSAVFNIERHQLRPAEGARESEQQQSAITPPEGRIGNARDDLFQVLDEQRPFAGGRNTKLA